MMGNEAFIIAAYTSLLAILFTAWVGGYLDGLQHQLQDVLLGGLGDNRASYGIKGNTGIISYLISFVCRI